MPRFSSRTTVVRGQDGAGVGITLGPGPGDFQWGPTNAENAEKVRAMDRGSFDGGHVVTDDIEQTWSLTLQLRNTAATSAAVALVQDFIHQTGTFTETTGTTPTTTKDANPTVWAFEILVTMTLGGVVQTHKLPLCLGDATYAEAKEGHTLSLSGTNNGAITRT